MSKKNISPKGHDPLRRKLMCWTPPLITAVMLPVHAQTSACVQSPVMSAAVESKCSGTPPVAQAVVTILSNAVDQIEIRSIVVSGASGSDTITLPTLPANVTNTVGIDIQWTGPATDATTCLPTSTITFAVSYGCASGSMDQMITFDLTTVLVAAIP